MCRWKCGVQGAFIADLSRLSRVMVTDMHRAGPAVQLALGWIRHLSDSSRQLGWAETCQRVLKLVLQLPS